MRKWIIPIVIVVAVVGGIGYYWWANYGGGSAAANAALGGSGTIEAEQIAITPQTMGRIILAPAQEGATVKVGDVLYKLDPSVIQLQIASLDTAINAASANYANVRDDSSSTWADKQAAKAQWEQALLAKKMAQIQLGYTTVRAPLKGVLTNIGQKAGENAVPGTTMAMLSQAQRLTVTIYVPETQIGQVKMGQAGTITTDSTTKAYNGKVTFIASQAEFTPSSVETKDQRAKLVFQVKLDVADADADLKPGMPADVVLKP
jgi:HlyD family secretion protein